MAAPINELFEEGVTRCGGLTDAADEAMNALDAATEQAGELVQRVEQEADEARGRLRELTASLEKSADALAASRGEAEGALQGLAGRAQDVERHVGEQLERIREAAARIDEQGTRAGEALDAHAADAQADVAELARRTQEADAEAARRLEEAGRAVASFRATIDAARAELEQKREAWSEALEHLAAAAHDQANAWVLSLQSLLQRQAAAIVEAVNVMVDRHNDAMEVIRQEFAAQAPEDLAHALEPVQTALRTLNDEATARENALAASVAELDSSTEATAPPLDDLRSALESAAELA